MGTDHIARVEAPFTDDFRPFCGFFPSFSFARPLFFGFFSWSGRRVCLFSFLCLTERRTAGWARHHSYSVLVVNTAV